MRVYHSSDSMEISTSSKTGRHTNLFIICKNSQKNRIFERPLSKRTILDYPFLRDWRERVGKKNLSVFLLSYIKFISVPCIDYYAKIINMMQ